MEPGPLIQLACASYLCGVIWVIQLIHYPSFQLIEPAAFANFHRRHSNVMTVVVGPVMLIELGSALYLARGLDHGWALNLLSVAIPFGATFWFSVPVHERLGRDRTTADLNALVRTNLIRTIAWTGRATVLAGLTAAGILR